MSRYIPKKLKNLVIERAKFRCEYCRISDYFSYFPFHIEHIISLKHGGETIESNLAYACPICNVNKGTDIATLVGNPPVIVRFFSPRTDDWSEHFEIDQSGLLISKTLIGEATIKILNLNHVESIIERKEMIDMDLLK